MKNFLTKFLGLDRTSPNEYKSVEVGGDTNYSDELRQLIKENRNLLTHNGVGLNKIKFTFTPSFTYDVDANVVNPKYTVMFPLRTDGSGLFDKSQTVIELNKPVGVVTANVNTYRVEDNYAFLRDLVKKSKRGVVIFIVNDEPDYVYNVDTDHLRLKNLDEIESDPPKETEQIL